MQGAEKPTSGALNGAAVIAFHQQCLALPGWAKAGQAPDGHALDVPPPATEPGAQLWHWVANNHRFNSLLWDEEDLARRTRVSAEEIAGNKRAIDGYNQARNDATERVDELLLLALGLVDPASVGGDSPVSLAGEAARMNSETAGSIIDRMSEGAGHEGADGADRCGRGAPRGFARAAGPAGDPAQRSGPLPGRADGRLSRGAGIFQGIPPVQDV